MAEPVPARKPIEPDEDFYRRIGTDQVDELGVSAASIDLPRPSFNRSAYSRPEGVLRRDRPELNGIAVITVEDIPAPFMRASGAGKLEWVPIDDPLPEEPAHAMILLTRHGEGEVFKNAKRPDKDMAKALLARAMRIHTAPS